MQLMDLLILYLVIVVVGVYLIIFYEARRKNRLKQLGEKLSQSGIRDIDQMSGLEFEQYLVALFRKNGYRVKITSASNDFGADLVLEGNERIVIQAKRYSGKVGMKAVQEISSAKGYYNAQIAWVITNNYFTSQAIKLAQANNVKLVDRNMLIEMILKTNTQKYFESNNI
ncbi:restriction endonuclease [Metabacillus niabensis]|uniref:Restriction system protein n=1 Tax=Metabacillus niabensis TaxID=324854 RepID=A0ABT9Z9K1_9BACI|nr:restriction endonuclease [Metabacillus niabensis]MDQ0228604.1 restriction system protein [Metabacillus niabensis]